MKSKWKSKGILITASGEYYDRNGIELIREVHQGALKYRIHGTSIRYSYNQLNNNKVIHKETIETYCPF